MKGIVLFLSVIVGLFACSSQSPTPSSSSSQPDKKQANPVFQIPEAENPDIRIKVEGVTQTGMAYLIGTFEDQRYRVDSAQASPDGTIHFINNSPYSQGYVVALYPDQTVLQLFISDDQKFSMTTNKNDVVNNMRVEGSLDNELFYENLRYETEHQQKMQALTQQYPGVQAGMEQYNELKAKQDELLEIRNQHLQDLYARGPNTLFTRFKQAGQNPEVKDFVLPNGQPDVAKQLQYFKVEFWDNVEFRDKRLLYTPVIFNKLKRYMTELTAQNADSIISSASYLMDKVLDYPDYYKFFANWIALTYEPGRTSVMDGDAIYVYMVRNYFTFDRAFWSDSVEVYALRNRAHEMSNSLIGQKGQNVEAKDPAGQMRSIYEITAPYIVIYMFNPDCEHCQEQTPQLVEAYKRWKNEGIEVFSIGVDTNEEEWRKYVLDNNLPFINVFDPTYRAIYAKYFVDITPEVYVLNPDRIIIGKNLNVNQVQDIIDRDRN